MSHRKNCELYHRDAAALGVPYDDAEALRRAAMTLHRWSEQECGDSNDYASWCITRDEAGVPFREVLPHHGKRTVTRIADRETGALNRSKAIAARLGAQLEYQGDPRGWPLTLKFSNGRELCPPVR
jgi:hypothetical protein